MDKNNVNMNANTRIRQNDHLRWGISKMLLASEANRNLLNKIVSKRDPRDWGKLGDEFDWFPEELGAALVQNLAEHGSTFDCIHAEYHLKNGDIVNVRFSDVISAYLQICVGLGRVAQIAHDVAESNLEAAKINIAHNEFELASRCYKKYVIWKFREANIFNHPISPIKKGTWILPEKIEDLEGDVRISCGCLIGELCDRVNFAVDFRDSIVNTWAKEDQSDVYGC